MCEKCGCAKCHESIPSLDDDVQRPTAVPEEHDLGIATEPTDAPLRRMLAPASSPQQRQLATLQLQRRYGNAFVQRLLQGTQPVPLGAVQRWAVGLDPASDCSKIVPYINANSPYKPKWAKTNAKLQFSDSAGYTATPEDDKKTKWSVTLPGATVSFASGPTIDMPVWAPTNATASKAWSAGMAGLQTHEEQHKNVFDSDQMTIESLMQNHFVSVAATSEDGAKAAAKPLFWAEAGKQLAVVQKNQDDVDKGNAGCAAFIDCAIDDEKTSAEGPAGSATGPAPSAAAD